MSLVEYHDPDGLFPVIAPRLQDRLPLRNLHWKSPSRPLRSIASLNVEFIAADAPSAPGNVSFDVGVAPSANGGSQTEGIKATPATNRKHQIPGLRNTPYLKLFILRCDDNEIYKTSKRALLKDWLLKHGTSIQQTSSRQENHDASEWLILHVVIPDTAAASQPRWSKSTSSDSEPPKEKSSSGKWRGRGSATILEKLRSDFNTGGKSGVDRIAQIRLLKDDVPHHMVPTAPSTPSPVETQQESDNAWADLITKLKYSILNAFGLRVGQYEDDVRERESQRSLPGWNFCTFFVLKEGLLRALESIGLVEDALVGYDELSAGLDAIVTSGSSSSIISTSFLEATPDFEKYIDAAPGILPEWRRPLSSQRKDYRSLIASNQISLFDFRNYIFSRQMYLLLYLAHPAAFQQLLTGDLATAAPREHMPIGTVDDAFALSDLLHRSSKFVTSMARLMKEDMYNSNKTIDETLKEKIDVVVHSWAFAAAHQILEDTSSPSFPQPEARKPKRIDAFPSRRSSLNATARQQLDNKSVDVLNEEEIFGLPADLAEISMVKNAELAAAATLRADLFIVQRRMLEHVASIYGLKKDIKGRFDDEESSDTESKVEDSMSSPDTTNLGYRGPIESKDALLGRSISSISYFRRQYQNLTDRSIWYFSLGGRRKSADRLLLDLAILQYSGGDFASASASFSRLVPSIGSKNWTELEASYLSMHADCLRALNRKDDYIRIAMALINQQIRRRNASSLETQRRSSIATQSSGSSMRRNARSIAEMFDDVASFSRQLPYDFNLSMDGFFSDVHLSNSIRHFPDKDGFRLSLRFRQLISDGLNVDSITVRLVGQCADQPRELWLSSRGKQELPFNSVAEIELESNASVTAVFHVDKIKINIGRLAFTSDFSAKVEAMTLLGGSRLNPTSHAAGIPGSRVALWPRTGCLELSVSESSRVHVGGKRHLKVQVLTGASKLVKTEIIIRAASAGLRLHTAEAKSLQPDIGITDKSKPGVLHIGQVDATTHFSLEIPYEIESPQTNITVKLEANYHTTAGAFTAIADESIDISLPLIINVQDVFKHKSVTSSFQLQSTTGLPLKLLDAELYPSKHFSVAASLSSKQPHLVYAKREAIYSFRITPQEFNESQDQAVSSLRFSVLYSKVQDAMFDSVSAIFGQMMLASQHSAFVGPLTRHLRQMLGSSLDAKQLHDAEQTGTIQLPGFEQMAWSETISNYCSDNTELQTTIETAIREWHKANAFISITRDSKMDDAYQRELIINFEIPVIQRLFTASVTTSETARGEKPPLRAYVTGVPVQAEIRVRYTTRWAERTTKVVGKDSHAEPFVLNVRSGPGVWAIVGPRQMSFKMREGQVKRFPLTLVPLRAGKLLLPGIEVDSSPNFVNGMVGKSGSGSNLATPVEEQTAQQAMKVPVESCETDCTSLSKTLTVIDGMKSTTIGVGSDEGLLVGSLALLESEPVS